MSDSGKQVRGVLFDYGMVLSGPPDPAAKARMAEIFGVGPERFHAAYWAHRDAYDRGALKSPDYWEAVARELSMEVQAEEIAALDHADVAHWTQPNEEMIRFAASLRERGVPTGILSNLGDAMEAGVRRRFPWVDDFAHATFSHRLGIAKPDAAIYAHAAEGMGLPAEEILFIDDREENIAAARAAGMLAIQYSTHAAFVAELKRLGLEYLLSE